MKTSNLIARLIGPLFLVMGLGMVIDGDVVRVISLDFLEDLALIYLAGILMLVAGLAILNVHNLWVANWRFIITIIGWLAVIGGVIRILFPLKVQMLGAGSLAHPHSMIICGVVTLVVGAILCWTGYELVGEDKPAPKPKPKPASAAAKPAPARAAKPKTARAAAKPKPRKAAAKPRARAAASRSTAKRKTATSRKPAKRAKTARKTTKRATTARKPRTTARKRR